MSTARKALGLLPGILGDDGPRNYLLIFQNDAEIKATGEFLGALVLVHADDGAMEIKKQGTAGDFPAQVQRQPVLPVSSAEEDFYGPLGMYFQDANFTPDFKRSSEFWHAWWDATFPDTSIDGVLSFDPVTMSYLLSSTGPVQVGQESLTPDDAVYELLSKPHLTGDNAAQDAFFAQAEKAIFSAVTNNLQSPIEFLHGLHRGEHEGRLHLTSFDTGEQSQIVGTRLEGALPADDGSTPRVQVAVNDATGSKMSYYLRYRAEVSSQSCLRGTQTLLGSMSLNQSIPAAAAATLSSKVTGGGFCGTEPGHQLVVIRIYGPTGGSIENLRLDSKKIDTTSKSLNGRPVALVLSELCGPDDVVLIWSMRTEPDQVHDGTRGVTHSVVPGDKSSNFRTAC